jgi:LysM repeat protein
MKTLFYPIFWMLLCVNITFGQSKKYIEHKVNTGETILQIAGKYKVAPSTIYSLNPDSQKGLKVGMVLLVPKLVDPTKKESTSKESTSKETVQKATTSKTLSNIKTSTHTVVSGDSFYNIAKKYGTTEAELQKLNQEAFKNTLSIGQLITIPFQKNTKPEQKTNDKKDLKTEVKSDNIESKQPKLPDFHTVVSKETIYSISKKYGLTTAEIIERNPEIKEGLQDGMVLKINPKGKKEKSTISSVKSDKKETKIIEVPKNIPLKDYTVKPKETFYGISKRTGLSEQQLTKLNPDLKDGLKEGMILKLPLQIVTEVVTSDRNREVVDLTSSLNTKNKKELAILLPFNLSQIEGDTVNTVKERLKKDKFLNITLDFYSGVMMAIDSAKSLNLNLDIKIVDSQENKNSCNSEQLIKEKGIDKSDVIIGPFYQANVEKTAELLKDSKAIIISPLSKETSKETPNLLQSMPNNDVVKTAMFDYMHSKNGNIIAIIDIKKVTIKKYISEKHPDVKHVAMDEKGNFAIENVTEHLVADKINYVIIESEKTGTILKTLNMLIGLSASYPIHLVILEKNPTFDFEEIPLAKLAKLRLTFPSMYKENQSAEGDLFEKKYKQKYKTTPNQYAIRGFDVTFDTLLRLSQENSFINTVDQVTTSQFENRFEYEKQASGARINKGIYILYYDTDLTVKEAN